MTGLRKHLLRIAVTLVPVLFAVLHASGLWRLSVLDRLDLYIYDVRMRATMPRTLDPRIVIVDIDEASLQRHGQWPWSRDKLARLTDELFDRQKVGALGFDVLFIERDASSPIEALRRLAAGSADAKAELGPLIERYTTELDTDGLFARALGARPVALGFYLTQSAEPRAAGALPPPASAIDPVELASTSISRWNGYSAGVAPIANAAATAGFVNVVLQAQADGVVRSVPLLARLDRPASADQGQGRAISLHQSLALAVYRLGMGAPNSLLPVLAPGGGSGDTDGAGSNRGKSGTRSSSGAIRATDAKASVESLVIARGSELVRIPVDQSFSAWIPFRGPGGPRGGSFRYLSAADVLDGRLQDAALAEKIVLVGTSAPGLQDLRPTPVDGAFPGVEVHANLISGLLDGRLPRLPDYAAGYELLTSVAAGLLLALALARLSLVRAIGFSVVLLAALVGLDLWLYTSAGLILPLACALAVGFATVVLSLGWGYFVEARAGRGLAALFGTYVPPQLVEEMRADPHRYDMRAKSMELTVMFCDMRDFTPLCERLAPEELQAFLNTVFSRLTQVISKHRGTVDKYMGDCVMAFWGAPVAAPDHASLAVGAALEMISEVEELNRQHRASGLPEVRVGIGINTGLMSVGDMGSALRRSYTVVGDAVNLASRIEGLGAGYGFDVVATASTRRAASDYVWQELDSVKVKGKTESVQIFTPRCAQHAAATELREELAIWSEVVTALRSQDAAGARHGLARLLEGPANKVLYRVHAERLASTTRLVEEQEGPGPRGEVGRTIEQRTKSGPSGAKEGSSI
ncbi:Adenylate cyclase [Burkholderiales bacterium 8X]|nr:Adenylate cyclase [Burkholderiales bacterium 8X]